MPTITFSRRDLEGLVGRKLTDGQLADLLDRAKAEIEATDEDHLTVKLNDTNQPVLWSVEGLARHFRGCLGLSRKPLKLAPAREHVTVDPSVAKVRPAIAAFRFHGPRMTEDLLVQLIQLQEKLAENYGRRRQKLGTGIYPAAGIAFPLNYTAVPPDAARFVPLGMDRELTLREVLAEHPRGKEYAWILKDAARYPILRDGKGRVLSLLPITNSEDTGRVQPGDTDLFFEATGSDERTVNLAAVIFAEALADRGYTVEPCIIRYGGRKAVTPDLAPSAVITLKPDDVPRLLGITLSQAQAKALLSRAGYAVAGWKCAAPADRQDIMHARDIIEDIAIMHGYGKLEPLPLASYTPGATLPMQGFIDRCRELLVGAGFQEVFSTFLSNKDTLYRKMEAPGMDTVEIDEYISENYSVLRSWLVPVLMEVLAENKHQEYPQRLFEQGIVTHRHDDRAVDKEKLALVSTHADVTYTELRQVLDGMLAALGIEAKVIEAQHPSFIAGRCAQVMVAGEPVGFLGELHPKVLEHWSLHMPAAAMELDLGKLYGLAIAKSR
jgi:phenylalanyl-tRNA synthetase beta chain